MKLSDYLKDADVVVRLKGAVVTPEQLQASGIPLSLNMYDALAVKTAAGLLTVASVSGRKAQTITASVSPIVAKQLGRSDSMSSHTYRNYQRNR